MLKEKNHKYYIDDVSIEELADAYGTPLYVYDISQIKANIQELRDSFLNKYENTTVSYAGKAFLCQAMVELIEDEGLNLDLVSGGELYTALQSQFPPKRIELNGNNKLYEELELAIQHKVGKIIVDGFGEIEILRELTEKYQQDVELLFRVTPGVDAHTHEYISTAKVDSKFGFPPEEVLGVLQSINRDPHLTFRGFHFHIGSQLFDSKIYVKAFEALLPLFQETIHTIGPIKEINVGGGFGINYTDEKRQPYSYFLDPLMEKIEEFFHSLHLSRPNITIEPGRSIVGDGGYTLYRGGAIKNIKGVRKYVSIDGGMTDNIRPALYGAQYKAVVDGKSGEEEVVTLCGKCCESGDLIIEDISLPSIDRGDLIMVFSTGAYGYSMASNYNHLPRPAVVFVEKDRHQIVVQREKYEDLMSRDHSWRV
ncbi:MAG: diaminopimelate decarboxylase [Tissierellia bacterium]|nr:diaminopimelate decarboxylase [Tissierellia bacterium]